VQLLAALRNVVHRAWVESIHCFSGLPNLKVSGCFFWFDAENSRLLRKTQLDAQPTITYADLCEIARSPVPQIALPQLQHKEQSPMLDEPTGG